MGSIKGGMATERKPGFWPIMRRLHDLLGLIGVICLGLGLARIFPETSAALIVACPFAIYLLTPPLFYARRIVTNLEAQGERVSFDDRLAAFLCVSLFLVPILFFLPILIMLFLGLDD